MYELIENTEEAVIAFLEGELTEGEIYDLIDQGYISESIFEEMLDYALEEDTKTELEEGKLWSQWRAYRNEKKSDKNVLKGNLWKGEKQLKRSIERGDEVLNVLNERKKKLDKIKDGAKIRKWWNNRQLEKHNAIQAIRKKKMDNMLTRIR